MAGPKVPSSELATLDGGKPPIPHRTSANGASGFEDVDRLRDANGLIAIISQRRSNGVMTIGVFKEFERDGRTDRTSFIPEMLFDAYEDLWELARKRVREIIAEGLAPFPIPPVTPGRRPTTP